MNERIKIDSDAVLSKIKIGIVEAWVPGREPAFVVLRKIAEVDALIAELVEARNLVFCYPKIEIEVKR